MDSLRLIPVHQSHEVCHEFLPLFVADGVAFEASSQFVVRGPGNILSRRRCWIDAQVLPTILRFAGIGRSEGMSPAVVTS